MTTIGGNSTRLTIYHLANAQPKASYLIAAGPTNLPINRVSRNTAPRAPRTPRAPRWNIFKTSRRWCLGFNWISRKISRKRRKSEGGELTKGRNGQLPAVHVYSQRGARGVRGAVFRDIVFSLSLSLRHGLTWHQLTWVRVGIGTTWPGYDLTSKQITME